MLKRVVGFIGSAVLDAVLVIWSLLGWILERSW